MASDAVGTERISKVVGYKITKGNFATTSSNLPQRIALLGEANDANQLTLDTDPFEITSAQQAGERYGYGSPLYLMARILFPVQGGGVGGVPVNSAKLEITSTTQGFLPPRMTTAQRDAISSPATGLTLYCTDCTATDTSTGVMQTYNGATWKNNW